MQLIMFLELYKIHSFNKDFLVQPHKYGISWFIQWFFIQSVIKLSYAVNLQKVLYIVRIFYSHLLG